MNSKEEFTRQMIDRQWKLEEILKEYLPEAEGWQKTDHGGNGVQSDWQAVRDFCPDADAGDLQALWRRAGDIRAFYGCH